jgi:hypothetical protein
MKLGLLAVLLPALKILAIRFVLVNNAAYTTVKQKPAPNLGKQHKKKLQVSCTEPVMPLQVPYSKNITLVYQQCAAGLRKLNKLPFRRSRVR